MGLRRTSEETSELVYNTLDAPHCTEELAHRLGLSVRTVQRAVADLRLAGLVDRRPMWIDRFAYAFFYSRRPE